MESEWEWVLENTGFVDVQWGKMVDVFSGSQHESSAKNFETTGVNFLARKPE